MTTNTRYLQSVVCDDVRALFDKLARKEFLTLEDRGVERLGAFRGHLRMCDQCRSTYGERLEALIAQALSGTTIAGQGHTFSPETQQALLARVTDPDLLVRLAALDALGSLGEAMTPAVQQALVEQLKDTNWTVRMVAEHSLAGLGAAMPQSVQQALVARLEDGDPSVREAASQALGELGSAMPESVMLALVERLADADQSVREAAEAVLLKAAEAAAPGTRSPKILARLEQLCEHKDRDVSNAAKRVRNALSAASQPTEGKSPLSQEKQIDVAYMAEWFWPVVGLQPVVSTLGGGPVQAHQTVLAIDSNGKEIVLTILSGPVLTKDGHFRFTVHGSEDHQIGMQLECAVTILKGERVRVLTSIRAASDRQGWEAVFDEVLLDPVLRLPTDRKIELGDRPLTVRPSIP